MNGLEIAGQVVASSAFSGVGAALLGLPVLTGAFQGVTYSVLNDVLASPLLKGLEKEGEEQGKLQLCMRGMLGVAKMVLSLGVAIFATVSWGHGAMCQLGRALPGLLGRVFAPASGSSYLFLDGLKVAGVSVGLGLGVGAVAMMVLVIVNRCTTKSPEEKALDELKSELRQRAASHLAAERELGV